VVIGLPGVCQLLAYGLRRGQVLSLSWHDVDLEHDVLRVRQQPLRARGRLQLGPVKTNSLRRTTATLLKDLGVPLRDTMATLGHARIAVTMEIYTGADEASRRAALSKLRALLGSAKD
jgi:integrase